MREVRISEWGAGVAPIEATLKASVAVLVTRLASQGCCFNKLVRLAGRRQV